MSTIVRSYDNSPYLLGRGFLDLSTAPVKIALLTSAYTPDVINHLVWADVSTTELNTGTFPNYVAGGAALVNQTFTQAGGIATLAADDITFVGASITCRYGLAYIDTLIDTYNKPLLYYILFDDLPQDVSREDFTIKWSPSGVLAVPKSS